MKKRLITTLTVLIMIIGLVGINTNSINAEDTTDYLCFTAEEAGSSVTLTFSPGAIETSTDKESWGAYTSGTPIPLANVGDEVYFRNTSESTNGINGQFSMTGKIAGSGDVTTLINKNGTLDLTSAGDSCFQLLFGNCTSLTSPPDLPATTLTARCYKTMFSGCSNLLFIPELPATTLSSECYAYMFENCSNIRVSDSTYGDSSVSVRIPSLGSFTSALDSYMMDGMFTGTADASIGVETPEDSDSDGVITLYMNPSNVTVTYNGNDSDGGSVPSSSVHPVLSEVTIKNNTGSLTKTGKVFKGWSSRPDGKTKIYNPDDTFTIRNNTTLYAIWEDGIDYQFTSGSGQTYTKGTLEDKLFTCDGPLTNLASVKVDNVEITENTQYTTESGSTKITLLGSYLETLDLGSHTLKLTYSDGPIPAVTFTVANPSTPEPDPTPDNNNNTFIIPNTGIR